MSCSWDHKASKKETISRINNNEEQWWSNTRLFYRLALTSLFQICPRFLQTFDITIKSKHFECTNLCLSVVCSPRQKRPLHYLFSPTPFPPPSRWKCSWRMNFTMWIERADIGRIGSHSVSDFVTLIKWFPSQRNCQRLYAFKITTIHAVTKTSATMPLQRQTG